MAGAAALGGFHPPGGVPSIESIADRAIESKYSDLGGAGGFLGPPLQSDMVKDSDSAYHRDFEGGHIYWSLDAGANEIHGPVYDRWISLGPANFGYPEMDTTKTSDGVGLYCRFSKQNEIAKTICWSSATGAHTIGGVIVQVWEQMGSVSGYGYPITDEQATPDGRARFCQFTGNRALFLTPGGKVRKISGPIKEKWDSLGSERSFLGFPTTDETPSGDHGGSYIDFDGGTIYYNPATGAHESGPLPSQLKYKRDHHFQGGAAANGTSWAVLQSDGVAYFAGHMHDSGAIGYNYVIAYAMKDADNQAWTLTQEGSIRGSFEIGSSDDNWNKTSTQPSIDELRKNWRAVCAGSPMIINAHVAADIGDFLGQLFSGGVGISSIALFGKWLGSIKLPDIKSGSGGVEGYVEVSGGNDGGGTDEGGDTDCVAMEPETS